MLLILYCVFLVLCEAAVAQKPSPCPDVFVYESSSSQEDDRWYGVVSLRTPEDLDGVWVHIILDRPAELLGVRKHD